MRRPLRAGAIVLALAAAGAASARSPGDAAAARALLAAPQVEAPFERTLRAGKLALRVSSANAATPGRVSIVPSGLSRDNGSVEREIDGVVTAAELADLDRDGAPELFVVVRPRDGRGSASLVAVATNRRRSLSDIVLPRLTDVPAHAAGYRGHDDFAIVEGRLWRRFPVYAPGDADDAPSGGVRQLRYKLVRGEASWRLAVDRVSAF